MIELIGHGCGEEKCLALLWYFRNNAANVGKKSHVEHSVCFVDDKYLEFRDVDHFPFEVVEEPPGTGNNDIMTRAQFFDLRLHSDTAIYSHASDAGVRSQLAYYFVNLFGKLAGWSENKTAQSAVRSGEQSLQLHGQLFFL